MFIKWSEQVSSFLLSVAHHHVAVAATHYIKPQNLSANGKSCHLQAYLAHTHTSSPSPSPLLPPPTKCLQFHIEFNLQCQMDLASAFSAVCLSLSVCVSECIMCNHFEWKPFQILTFTTEILNILGFVWAVWRDFHFQMKWICYTERREHTHLTRKCVIAGAPTNVRIKLCFFISSSLSTNGDWINRLYRISFEI